MKICLIANLAPHYREEIFRLIDARMDCDFAFGDTLNNGIRTFSLTGFRNKVTVLKNIQNGEVTLWQKGVLKMLSRRYSVYILSGDIRCFSTWTFLIVSAILRKKVFLWTHGWTGREGRVTRWMKMLFYSFSDGLFLYGDYARRLMVSEGYSPSRLHVIHNSLSHAVQLQIRRKLNPTSIYRKHFGNALPVLIFIGRLTPSKKLDMILDAMRILQDRHFLCNLVLVGSGPAEVSLRQTAASLGLQDRVWLYGPSYNENVNAELIYNADLCVSPGNIGLTAVLVLTYGTPAVTHDLFKCQGPEFEAIHPGVTGDFYEYGLVVSLADRIESWLLSSKGRRMQVRKACQDEIDRYWTPEYQFDVINQTLLKYAGTSSD